MADETTKFVGLQKDKLKVLFLPAWYPNKTDTMAGLFVKYHALAVQPFAHVAVLHIVPIQEQAKAVVYDYFDDEGLPTLIAYIRKQPGSVWDKLLFPLWYIQANIKGYRLIKEKFGRPDIYHVHILTRSGLLAWWKKKTRAIPYIITEHWSRYLPQNSSSYQGWFRKWLTRQVAKNAAAITTVSAHLGNAMQQHGLKNNYTQVSNVVNTDFFKPLPHKPVNPKPVLLHVSCFDEKPKNVKGILEAIHLLEQEGMDFEMRFVGDGKDLDVVKEYAIRLGVKNAVFTGLKTGTELLHEYQMADAFVLFSNFENQPVVLLEAFACGLPVVATTVGGIPEILQEGFGILVPPGNVQQLVSTLKGILQGTASFQPPAAMHAFVQQHYSYDAVGSIFANLYTQVLSA